MAKDIVPVEVTGSKRKVEYSNYDQVLNLAPSANIMSTIIPPPGELWRVKNLNINIVAPVGATAGTHAVYVGLSALNGGRNWLLNAISNFGDVISITNNYIANATATGGKVPTSEQAQQANILSLVVTSGSPLLVYYSNNTTGGTQSATWKITINREVEYIS